MITQTETLVALVTQLGLSSTVPLDRNLYATGKMTLGNSIYLEPGDYFRYGLKSMTLKRTTATAGPLKLAVFRHYQGERIEVFTTTLPADRLEQLTLNDVQSLFEVVVPHATDIWELYITADNTDSEAWPVGAAVQLILTP